MIAEKISILNKDNYNSVYEMIASKDEGSRVVGFSVLENVNYEKSEIFLLCMLKQLTESQNYHINMNTVKNEASQLYHKIHSKCKDLPNWKLSYKYIYEIAVKRTADTNNKHEIEFLLNLFKNELLDLLTQYGFSFLEHLDIEIKQKINE